MPFYGIAAGVNTGKKRYSSAWEGTAAQKYQLVTGGGNENNIRTGKLRALAASGAQRMRAWPQLPTVKESGVPNFEIATWFGLQTTAGVPRPIIERLNREVGEWLRLPETRDKLADRFSLDLTPSTPEEMAERISREIPLFTRVMRAAGSEPE